MPTRVVPRLLGLACVLVAAAAAAGTPAAARAQEQMIPAPAVLPPHAHFPAPWVGLVGSDAQATGFDPTRLTFAGDTATVWLRHQFPRDLPMPGAPGRTYRAIEQPYQLRCEAGRARATGAMHLFTAGGDTLGSRAAWDPRPWEPLDHVFDRVCRCVCYARDVRRARRALAAARRAGA